MSGRHQKHSVRNRNRKLRKMVEPVQPPQITIHRTGDWVFDPQDGRLKVIPKRDFEYQVPYEMTEGKHSYEHAPNPVNQLGAMIEDNVPVATSNDFASFLAAFNKRSNFIAQKNDDIDDDVFNEALALINSIPDGLFEPWDENEIDRNRWLAKFNDGKRRRMEEGFRLIPYADYKYAGTKDLSVKQEILMKRYDDTWAPRLIYAGNDVFNAITGPAAMVVMERFCHFCAHNTFGGVDFLPAYKQNDVAIVDFLMDSDTDVHTIEGDYSRNDREQRARVALIIDAWLSKFKMPQWYRDFCLETNNYKVQNRQFGFIAWLIAQLPTGTTATTYRNSMYNATMFAVTALRQKNTGRATILGDDLLARMRKRFNLSHWVQTIAKFKMVLKAKDPEINGAATFLSRRIFADHRCMMPLIGKMLARFNARGTSNSAVDDDSYMAGKALSYAYECRHVPFVRNFFLQRYKSYADVKPVFDDLSWFTRSSGLDSLDAIVEAINNERVIVSDDDFRYWLCEFYDTGTYELQDLMERIVLNPTQEIICMPHFAPFMVDIA